MNMDSIDVLVIDCLTAGDGKRIFTRDFIGAGPRTVAGFIEAISEKRFKTDLIRSDECLQSQTPITWTKYPIIAISAMSMDEEIVHKILNSVQRNQKEKNSSLIIIGGPIATDNSLLTRIPADLMITGEAEVPLNAIFHDYGNLIIQWIRQINHTPVNERNLSKTNLLKSFLSQIPGIAYRINTQIVHNPKATFEQNIWFRTSTGYPEKINMYSDFTQARIYIDCVRGCSNYRRTALFLANDRQCQAISSNSKNRTCTVCRQDNFVPIEYCPSQIPPGCGFCSTINIFGPSRSRDIQPILREIQELIRLGAHRLVLGGPDFLDFQRENLIDHPLINPNTPEPNYPAIEELISQLLTIPEISAHSVQLFIENVKTSLCTDKALQILAKIPYVSFSIGCETGSPQFANLLGRPNNPFQTLEVVRRAQKYGIRVHVYFIHSLPGDRPEFLQDTLKLLEEFSKIPVEKITLYKYQELPGSPFSKMPAPSLIDSKNTNKLTEKLKRYVINYNEQQKYRLLGKILDVYLSEKNMVQPSDAMGWILEGGPKVSVRNATKMIGQVHRVQITKVLSDRLVEGDLV